jgi:hypothetical protein
LHLESQAWEIELAALVSQIGTVTMPHHILERWQRSELLTESEAKMIKSIPQMGKLLIKNIPRLENIAEAVGYQNCTYNSQAAIGAPVADDIPLIARILKVIVEFDRLLERSYSPSVAFRTMLVHQSEYDPNILAALRFTVLNVETQSSYKISGALKGEKEIFVEGIKLGMTLSRDVVDKNGILIVSKDTVISDVLMYKLFNYFQSQALSEHVYIENTF